MEKLKNDITNAQDVKLLVDSFYDKINKDDLLSPIFNQIAHVHWDAHLEKMYKFWGTMLLNEQSYKGAAYQVHANLPVESKHFKRWLELFNETVDSYFTGINADDAKKTAYTIGLTFQAKMGISSQ